MPLRTPSALALITLTACTGAARSPDLVAGANHPAVAVGHPPLTPAPAAMIAAPAPRAEVDPIELLVIPTECANANPDRCAPPAPFVDRLCSGSHPDAALAMFRKGTPWTRAYLTRDVEAWRASGRRSAAMSMALGEEVLVVSRRESGGMIVGGGSYDIIRWDGSCASLMADELAWKRPTDAGHAIVPWRKLDERTRGALAEHSEIARLEARRRKECRTAGLGAGSPACAEIDERLSGSVVNFVRRGGALPVTELLVSRK